jgi:hypothetical protein
MTTLDLSRRLRRLRRTVMMLGTELRRQHLDATLLADIENQMEHGIAGAPGCEKLRTLVDSLRESTLTPRPELFSDAVRACDKLIDALEEVSSRL